MPAIENLDTKIEELARNFERDGYAVLKNFLTNEEVEALRDESLRLIKEESVKERQKQIFGNDYNMKSKYFVDSGDRVSYFFEEKAFDLKTKELVLPVEQSIAKIAHALHHFNPIFKHISTSQKVQGIFKAIGYKEPTIAQSMVIFKNPKVGGEYFPHQDASYLCTEPVHVAGIWLALDDATPENGCLEFIPGSHRWPLNRRFVRTGQKDGALLKWVGPTQEYDENKFVAAPVKRGDLVLLDGVVIHRSAPNNSDKSRWIYTFHVFDKDRAVYQKDNWLQPDNTNTFMPIFQKN